MITKKKLWAFNDVHNWGVGLLRVAQARGYDAHLFEDPRDPDEGVVMVHIHHHPSVRLIHKRIMATLASNRHLVLVPDYRSSVLYDDKLEQLRNFAQWMPRTRVFTSPPSANKFLNSKGVKYPFISKTAEGAGSHNVRFIKTEKEAREEIKFAFSDIGIKCKYGQAQHGYVMWQEYLAGNEGDIRIIAIGSKRMILKRKNRQDRPMASGSGDVQPITKMDDELRSALQFANLFFGSERQSWCGIDLVRDPVTKEWRLLETTVGWTMNGYYECRFFDGDGTPTKYMGSDVWSVFLDEYEAGMFS